MRIHQSAPTERAFMTRRTWQHPSRREHVHGRVIPMDNPYGGNIGKWVMFAVAVMIGAMLAIGHSF